MPRTVRVVLLAAIAVQVAAWVVLLAPMPIGDTGYLVINGESMEPTYETGDLVLVRSAETYGPGDVVAYRIPDGQPGAGSQVIHRIVGGDALGYDLIGDNNDAIDPWHPTPDDVLGAELVHLPKVGYVLYFLRQPMVLASVVVGLCAWWAAGGTRGGHDDAVVAAPVVARTTTRRRRIVVRVPRPATSG